MTSASAQSQAVPLDRLVCLDLYSTSRAVIKAYRPLLDRLNLTYPQYLVMMALWESGALGVKDLAEKLDLDSGTLSPLLKRLETAGLVSRTRSKQDEREVSIDLTAAGQAMQKESLVVCEAMYPRFGMLEADVRTLQETLRNIRHRMNEEEPS